MKNMNCGVYQIMCTVNGKIYIGGSIDIKRRWSEHRLMLKKGVHHTKHLQAAWNKHGEKSFKFSILEETNEEQVEECEKQWIELKDASNKLVGFNNKYRSREGTWMCVSKCKEYIITHPSGKNETIINLRSFCRLNDLNQGAMIAVANHKLNHHQGFHCRFADESFKEWVDKRKTIVDTNKKNKAPMSKKHTCGYLITEPDGVQHQVSSLTDFCKQHNLSQGNMTEVAKGNRAQHKGYRCAYLNSTK